MGYIQRVDKAGGGFQGPEKPRWNNSDVKNNTKSPGYQ